MKASSPTPIEPLEARIAPALTLVNALPDIVAGIGKTGANIDLSGMYGDTSSFHTKVRFTTNFDIDPNTIGLQAGVIEIELFDNEAPLTVQNFLQYVNGTGSGDFDGTFFHRSVPGFVLQGGGFESSTPAAHIPVGLPVHNEYSPLRSNLAGTLAMAKTEVGPNSATSEFFVNLADNSSNLDNQNGGFTVFGKVTQGMDVVNAIANQPRKNFASSINGALSDVPVQPGYSTGTPTAADFITITDAAVIAPADQTAPGVTYSVVSVTDNATQRPSKIVEATLTGTDSLALNYTAGKSGVATVKIKASQPGAEDQFEEFQVTVKPNLIVDIVDDGFSGDLVPGDSGKVKVQLTNNGAGPLVGKVNVAFYLSKVGAEDPKGSIFDSSDRKIGELKGASLKLASGASTFVTGKINAIGSGANLNLQSDAFTIIAVVESAEGAELFTDDNSGTSFETHKLQNVFGSVFDSKNVPLSYTDADGNAVTFTLSGGGYGQLILSSSGEVDLAYFNTTAASTLKAKVVAAPDAEPGSVIHTELRNINPGTLTTARAAIGTVDLGAVDLHGDAFFRGGVRSLALGDLIDSTSATSHVIDVGAFTKANQATSVRLGTVTDYGFRSYMPVNSLTAAQWIDSNPVNELISAVSLKTLSVTGNLEADLRANFDFNQVAYSKVKLAAFNVGGSLKDATIELGGDAGRVSLGSMVESHFLVGATSADESGYLFTEHSVDSFVIKGASSVGVLRDSVVAAGRIGSIRIESVDGSGGANESGIVAQAIKDYLREGTPSFQKTNLAPGIYDPIGNYSVRVVA